MQLVLTCSRYPLHCVSEPPESEQPQPLGGQEIFRMGRKEVILLRWKSFIKQLVLLKLGYHHGFIAAWLWQEKRFVFPPEALTWMMSKSKKKSHSANRAHTRARQNSFSFCTFAESAVSPSWEYSYGEDGKQQAWSSDDTLPDGWRRRDDVLLR